MTKLMAVAFALAAKAQKVWLSTYTLGSVATIGLTFLFIAAVTARRRGGWRNLLNRNVATDACWTVFYLGGFYAFFIGAPLYKVTSALVTRFAPWLRASLLVHLHPAVHFMILWLAIDLTGYWWHRLAHRSSLLWQFHRVHHSQSDLQPLTNYRFHFIDLAVRTSLQYFPAIVIGSPTSMFLSAAFLEIAIDGLAHADVGWSYGIFGKLIMNPAFHRLHHSTEARHFDRNFGLSFSVWDRIFGTAVVSQERPQAYGVEGPMPLSFFRQFFFPFFAVARSVVRPSLDSASPTVERPPAGPA